MKDLEVKVLIRCSAKTGKIDTTMTALGSALLKLWALNNTKSGKQTFIIDRETGKVEFACQGKKNDFPTIADENKLGTCEDLGISLELLNEMGYDERFDKEEK